MATHFILTPGSGAIHGMPQYPLSGFSWHLLVLGGLARRGEIRGLSLGIRWKTPEKECFQPKKSNRG